MTESLTGNLLVASSLVEDPIYAGGVCLIVHEDETNVIGVMLNRPMKPSADALLKMLGGPAEGSKADLEAEKTEPGNRLAFHGEGTGDELDDSASMQSDTDFPHAKANALEFSPWRMLHFGGPLSGPVVAIHQVSQLAEAETGSGIYVAAQKQHLEYLMRGQTNPYRLIVGHLGWETDQLQTEIDSGFWHVVPATVETVFSPASEMWPRLIRRATSNSLARWVGIPDVIGAGDLN